MDGMTKSPPEPTILTDDAFVSPVRGHPKRRRWLYALLACGAVMGVIAFGGCLIFAVFCEAKQVTAPDDVLQAARELTDLALPDGYVGDVAETVRTPMFVVRKAIFRHESGKGVLTLAAMRIHWIAAKEEAEATRNALDQLAGEMHQIIAEEESMRTLTIREEPAEFQVRFGSDTLSSTKYHEVRGQFRGKLGMTQLWWQAEDAVWNVDGMERLLKSLAAEGAPSDAISEE